MHMNNEGSGPCACGSGRPFEQCCGSVIAGERPAETAEALMRARYSAYVAKDIDFLGESLHPAHRHDWDRAGTARWADGSEWLGLEIRATSGGMPGDREGTVEFVAAYKEKGEIKRHHEISRFERVKDRWYYVDGTMPKPQTLRNEGKIGRNDPCPCGSGKKYKKCCGR